MKKSNKCYLRERRDLKNHKKKNEIELNILKIYSLYNNHYCDQTQ